MKFQTNQKFNTMRGLKHDSAFILFISSKVESSPGPISPSDERHNVSSGSGNSSGGGSAPMMATSMPLSDNNVSTTNMALANTAWDIPESEQDINVSVLTYGQW